jgi:hypothetical protein
MSDVGPHVGGNIQPQLDVEEHNHLARAKRTTVVGSDGVNYNELKIDSNGAITTIGGAAGIQYTEGDVDTLITGTAAMWEDTGDTMRPISAVFPLPVNIVAGSSAGITFDDGDAIDTTSQGTLILGSDGMPGSARVIRTAADGSVRVDPTGTTAQPVTDNGGSLTVDGPLTDAELRATPVDVLGPLTDAELRATPVPVSGTVTTGGLTDAQLRATPVPVSGTVAVSNQNTQYTENDVDASITGNAMLGEGMGSALRPLQVDANDALKVVGHNGILATNDAVNNTDNAAFTQDSNLVSVTGYILDEVAGTALTENDAAAARIDSKRAQVFTLEDETTRGRRTTVTAANALKVDGSAVTQPVSGTVTVTDGSGSLTVDGTVAATQSGSWSVTADTELPAAAALSDALANPTTPLIGSCLMRWDGTQWQRSPHSFFQTRLSVGTASGAGTSVDMTTNPCAQFAMQIENQTGTTSAWNISQEGSLDGTVWISLQNSTSATGAAVIIWTSGKPVRFMRSNVTSITGGGTVRVRILAKEA